MATKVLLTAEQFFAFDGSRHCELVRGEVVDVSPPGFLHGETCAQIVHLLKLYAGAKKRGVVLSNVPGLIVERDPDTVRGPDILYYPRSRVPARRPEGFSNLRPDLVVEVVSPNDTLKELKQKVKEYRRMKIPLIWIVDPSEQDVTVYYKDRPPLTLAADAEITGEDVLPGFRCRVKEFFT